MGFKAGRRGPSAAMGDGVNIAARLEGIAAPGAICLPRTLTDK